MSQIYVAEITAYDPAISGTRVLRYCTGTGYTTGAADSPAHTFYEPRIEQPANSLNKTRCYHCIHPFINPFIKQLARELQPNDQSVVGWFFFVPQVRKLRACGYHNRQRLFKI